MARIELPSGDLPEVARALTLAPHFIEVVTAYEKAVASSRLDPRLHELVRMRIAVINDCTICLNFRNPASGATERMLAAVTDYGWRSSTPSGSAWIRRPSRTTCSSVSASTCHRPRSST
jgi:alkylhydroperoxidase family enzyme